MRVSMTRTAASDFPNWAAISFEGRPSTYFIRKRLSLLLRKLEMLTVSRASRAFRENAWLGVVML